MKNKTLNNKTTKQAIIVGVSFVTGVFLLAICYNMFLLPNNFVVAGMSGIGIALEELFGISATGFIYSSTIILLIVSFIFLGFEKTKHTIMGSILYPIMISLTNPIANFLNTNYPIDDNLIIIIFAIVSYGVGNGLVYKYGYTTGGNDVLMQLLNKYCKIPESKGLTAVNIIVILFGAATFGYMKAIYATIILLLSTQFIDKIMFGIADSKLFYIFTREEAKVKKIIIEELESGYTVLPTKGGYSHTKGSLLMCVVPNRDYYLFKERILEIDPRAFFIIDSCYEVNGGVKRPNLRLFDK